jgi:alanine-synthesizing transaminase
LFSSRIQSELAKNRLTKALERCRSRGDVFIDLTESNPTRAALDYPDDLLAALADSRGLVYTPEPFGTLEARCAVAAEFGRRSLGVHPERIVLTASTSEAYSLLFKVLCNAGDEVLVPRPSYPLFEHLTALDAVVARPYDLEYHGVWAIDFDSLERACSPSTRAVIIVSPNNPTGSFVKEHELDRIAAVCARHNAAIVADEVFAEYPLADEPAAASGQVLTRRDGLMFSLGGLSKSAGLPQVKVGWIVCSGRDELVRDALGRLELACDSYLSVSTPAQVALPDLLRRGADIRAQILARVRANYRSLQARAAATATCRVLAAEGGWYAVVQVPSLGPEEDLVIDLVERHGVLAHPGYFFDFPRESFLIVSLLVPETLFREGVSRLFGYFDCTLNAS